MRIILIFIFFLSVSCSSENISDDSLIVHVDNKITPKEQKVNEWFKDVQIIRIQSSNLISETKKIVNFKDAIYILDRNVSQSLFVLDNKYKEVLSISSSLLSEIFHKETKILDFHVDEKSILILTNNPSCILTLDLKGKIIKKTSLKFKASRFLVYSKDNFLFYKTLDPNNSETKDYFYHLIFTDKNGNFSKGIMPFTIKDGERVYFDVEEPFGKSLQNQLFSKAFSDTILKIEANKMALHLAKVIDYKTQSLSKKNIVKPQDLFKIISDPTNNAPFGISQFNESKSHISFIFGQNATSNLFLLDKQKQKSGVITYFKDTKGNGYLPLPLAETANSFIGILDESSLAQLPTESSVSQYYQDLYTSVSDKGASYLIIYNK